jgi:hypothetical protein
MKKLIIFLQIQEGGAFESSPYHEDQENVTRLGTPNSHVLTMERFLLNSDCVFCDPSLTVLRAHISTCHSDGPCTALGTPVISVTASNNHSHVHTC